ncbi:MAG: FGGY-family carbohydrate kinase [Olsenella profusa]
MHYYIGLDNGGTTTKAALFAQDGRQLASASMATESITSRPEFVERDMDGLWDANCKVVRDVLATSGVDASDVACIGVCGHGKGLYLWGKDDRPCRLAIASTDNRAQAYVDRWRSDGTEAKAFAISCQHVMSCQPVALLAWLKDNERASYDNIRYVFECKDYVRFRLTGEAAAEMTDYSGANLVNLHTARYDERLLELFGICEVADALPDLCRSDEVAGHICADAARRTGLIEGTPVVGGFFDIDACALASGILSDDLVCMIAGTWSINEYIRTDPVLDGSVAMNSYYCLPGYYLVEESSATSAGNNEWFIRQLLPEVDATARQTGTSVYDVINGWVGSLPPEHYVPLFLPFLMGSNVHPRAKACFIGMDVSHTRKDLARSVYEGITFCHRMHFDRLRASMGGAPTAIRLSGGAAKSSVWAQMFADVMGLPVETVIADEAGALGCAIACSVAVGDAADVPSAVGRMVRVAHTFEPDARAHDVYECKYHLYRKAARALDGLWDELNELME